MSKETARRKRANAIRTLRECGMTDAEIEAELGCSLQDVEKEDAEIIDVEVISETLVDETNPRSLTPMVIDVPPHWKPPQWSEEWWEQSRPAVQCKRCTAHNVSGKRCQRISIDGARVCYMHGGAAPAVRAAARARLENAADRMARNLLGLATEADSETVKLGATNSALDRAGLRPPNEVVLSQGNAKPYEEVFDEIAGVSREESRRARGFLEPDAEDRSNASGFDAGWQGSEPSSPSASASRADEAGNAGAEWGGDPTGYEAASASVDERDSDSAGNGPPRRPRPSQGDRDRHDQRPADTRSATAHHITGDDALRVAAQLTREQLALESPHKRYKRPQ